MDVDSHKISEALTKFVHPFGDEQMRRNDTSW